MSNDKSLRYPPQITTHAIAWARQAGQIALHYFNNVSVEYKPDDTLVTQADVEIEQVLAAQIRATYPDHGLVGEEGLRSQTDSAYTWVIDPLDGTSSFVQGLSGWGILIGLLHAGQPVFGLFYMPLLDDLTYSTCDGICVGKRILRQTVRRKWRHNDVLVVNTQAHHEFEIDVPRTHSWGSVGANLVYTARGQATAALISKARLWDLVAPASILQQAGGELRYLSGAAIDYNALMDGHLISEPIMAGHPDLLDDLQEAIRRRGA